MIDKNLPEPKEKRCADCGRTNGKMSGTLIHWPSEEYEGKEYVKTLRGQLVEPFSFWGYECQWCRGVETKRKRRAGEGEE